MPQLIININDNLLTEAQAYARQKGQELDALVTNLLESAIHPEQFHQQPTRPLSARVQRLFGAVQVPTDFDYKASLAEALRERHGL